MIPETIYRNQTGCLYEEPLEAKADSITTILGDIEELAKNKDGYYASEKVLENESQIREATKQLLKALDGKLITVYKLKK